MRGLLVVSPKYPPQPGGASYVFSLISRNLSRKINTTVLTSTEKGFFDIEKRHGVKVFRLFPYFENRISKIIFSPITFFSVFVFFLTNHRKFDVVETHTVGEISVLSQFFSKLFRKKLIKHVLDMSTPDFSLKHPFPDTFINCGRTITRKILGLGVARSMIEEIRLPIAYRKNKNFKKGGKKTFLFVGEISHKKGIADILDVMTSIKENNFEFLFVGSGPMTNELKDAAKRDKRIRYLGIMDNNKVVSLMKRTDVLVHPTYADVMPLSILEAMMMGNAILSTDIGEIKKTVGRAGIIIKPGDLKSLKKFIIKMINKNLNQMKKTSIKNFAKYSKQDVYQMNMDSIKNVLELG